MALTTPLNNYTDSGGRFPTGAREITDESTIIEVAIGAQGQVTIPHGALYFEVTAVAIDSGEAPYIAGIETIPAAFAVPKTGAYEIRPGIRRIREVNGAAPTLVFIRNLHAASLLRANVKFYVG